jgi:hypothetical protein
MWKLTNVHCTVKYDERTENFNEKESKRKNQEKREKEAKPVAKDSKLRRDFEPLGK